MIEGNVALTPLPQVDGQTKPRPIILLRQMPPFDDWLVCGISTQLHRQVAGFDEIIDRAHPDFVDSGLKAASVIRLGFLAVFPADRILGVIGSISASRHRGLLQRLAAHLTAKPTA